MSKLIFVEGIMGSGKSTTAKFVVEELERVGTPVRLIDENDDNHPVQMADPEEFESIDVWMTDRLDKWAALTDSILQSGDVFVMDGQLFHESVDSLFYFDVPEGDIVDFMTRTMDVLEKVSPALIYFFQADVGASLRKTCEARSEWWRNWQIDWKVHNRPYGQKRGLKGFNGYVQLYSEYRALTDRLFANLEIEKLDIENSAGDWDQYKSEILIFIREVFRKKIFEI